MRVRRIDAAMIVVASVALGAMPVLAAGEDEALKQAAAAIKGGKADAAIKFISNVLAVKGLPPALIAKGYYLRGLAYQKSGKPAQALADVSQALWLKQLSANDAADAQKIKAAALGEVGKALPGGGPEKVAAPSATEVNEPAKVASEQAAAPAADGWSTEAVAVTAEPVGKDVAAPVEKPAKKKVAAEPSSWSTESVAEPRVVAAPVAEPEAPDSVGGFFSSLFSGGSSEPATQSYAPVAKAEPAADAASAGWSPSLAMAPSDGGDVGTPWLQKAGSAEVKSEAKVAKPKSKPKDDPALSGGWQVAAVEPAAPAVAEAEPQSSSGGGLLSDLSNSVSSLFGGGAASEPVADQTASIAKPAAKRVAAVGESGWSNEVAAASGGESVYDAPAKDPSKLPAAAEPAAGQYLLQVASALSAAEAQDEAARIASLDPALAAQVEQRIVAKDLGAGGKFFNVHMGPFASQKASLAACSRLKKLGIGCFPVVQ